MNWLDEFKKAYDDFPSQDNEGYIPDRVGFKAGFSSAWKLQEARVAELEGLLDKAEETLKFIDDHDMETPIRIARKTRETLNLIKEVRGGG